MRLRTDQVAIAWASTHGTVPMIGPRSLDQLRSNLGATTLELSWEHVGRLDAVWDCPVSDTAGECSNSGSLADEASEGRSSGRRDGLTRQPIGDPADVEGGGGQHVLEVDLGEPEVASPPQMQGPHAQRQCPFNTRPPAVLLGEGPVDLSRACRLQRGVFLSSTRREQPARGNAYSSA